MGGGAGVGFSVITFIVVRFLVPAFNAANHKRIRSVCCGRSCVTSLDVEPTSPSMSKRVVVDESGVAKSGVGTGLSVSVP